MLHPNWICKYFFQNTTLSAFECRQRWELQKAAPTTHSVSRLTRTSALVFIGRRRRTASRFTHLQCLTYLPDTSLLLSHPQTHKVSTQHMQHMYPQAQPREIFWWDILKFSPAWTTACCENKGDQEAKKGKKSLWMLANVFTKTKENFTIHNK